MEVDVPHHGRVLVIKRILLLGAFALVAGAVVRVMTAPAPAVAVSLPAVIGTSPDPTAAIAGSDSHPHWREIWTRAVPDLQALSLSPDGGTIAWVDSKGSVRRIAASDGDTLWRSAPLAGLNDVVAAPFGNILAYSRLNPAKPMVRVFDGASKTPDRNIAFPIQGAVWSVDVDANGERAFVGGGKSEVTILPLHTVVPAAVSPKIPVAAIVVRPLRLRTIGIPNSIASTANGSVLIAGTWQAAGVSAWNAAGSTLWSHEEPAVNRTYEVHVSADGSTVVAVSSTEPHGMDSRLHVWDAHTGRLVWSQSLNAFDAHALVSADGNRIAVSYARQISDGPAQGNTAGTAEREVVLYDRAGHLQFPEKGGMYFAPQLIALSSDGTRVTVRDSAGYLWTLDDQGKILSRIRLSLDSTTGSPPVIRDTASTADGTTLLINRGDGQISLFKASAH